MTPQAKPVGVDPKDNSDIKSIDQKFFSLACLLAKQTVLDLRHNNDNNSCKGDAS